MKIHAFICTRKEDLRASTELLLDYLDRAGVEVHLLVNKDSIFTAYSEELAKIKDNDDIVIMCHDDIEILNDIKHFKDQLTESLKDPACGFVGVAGTRRLTPNGVWWDQTEWKAGNHHGFVFHGESLRNMQPTWYGNPGKVVVLDGLFLASKVKTLKFLGLEKPVQFKGDWDFYDIHYTLKAYESGYYNQVVPIFLRHESFGELAGRDSWHQNRQALLSMYRLPVWCHS